MHVFRCVSYVFSPRPQLHTASEFHLVQPFSLPIRVLGAWIHRAAKLSVGRRRHIALHCSKRVHTCPYLLR